jgi:hypothetical protein
MDRKQFLYSIWKWVFIPSIIVVVGYFCINFLIDAICENSFERFLTIGILGIIVLIGIAQVFGRILKRVKDSVYSKLSDNTKQYLRIIGKIFDYVAVLALGAMLYMLWTKDKFLGCLFVLILLIDRVRQILKEEKSKATTISTK